MNHRAQKRRRPGLAGPRRLPQETDSVAGSILSQDAAAGKGNLRPAASSFCEHRLVEPAQVARLIPNALRHLRELLARPAAAVPPPQQEELF